MTKEQAMALFANQAQNRKYITHIHAREYGFLLEGVRWCGEVHFLDREPTVDELKTLLLRVGIHTLVIVDQALLIGAGEITSHRPMWVQILHACYYGRVYCYGNGSLNAMHLEYLGDGEYVASYCPEPIDAATLKHREIDCKHQAFQYHVFTFMFGEASWWTSQYRTHEQKQQRAKQEQPRQQRYVTKLDEYLSILELAEIPPKTALKAQYRKLARQWHPDVCKLPEAEDKMKAINAAYEFVSEYVR